MLFWKILFNWLKHDHKKSQANYNPNMFTQSCKHSNFMNQGAN